jgi:hypothetical protein
VLFGFALVAQLTGTKIDLGAIQANVLEANTRKVVYDADLIMERSTTGITIRIGKNAENVDALTFSLLWDPSIITGLSADRNTGTSIINNEPGIYLVKVSLGRSLSPGDVITTLTPKLSGNTSLAMIDAGFTSSGASYSLSVKGE